ncbi:hypothetical protein HYW87_03800, partial [Candidatus Roizmanbacteria bacterium]|nr:hypothetical protein [Candidatus Roizmanbacteria bacterium]
MKKNIFFLLILGLFVGFFLVVNKKDIQISPRKESPQVSIKLDPSVSVKGEIRTKSIFVPYWSNFESFSGLEEYNRLFYFGITANEWGIVTGESGYQNIEKFISASSRLSSNSNIRQFLTLRLLDSNSNFKILENRQAQEKIISDTIDIAKEYKFNGILLD